MKGIFLSSALLLAAAPAWPRAGGGGGGGGCFPAGTPILTLEGNVPIEKVRPGDTVLAFSNERLVKAEVLKFIKKNDRLIKITTNRGTLVATPEHPLMTRYGFTEVRDLKKGWSVAVLEDGKQVWARIKSIKPAGVADVYNLEVAPPHTFIAAGFIVHNKGGGFGGGGHYYGGRYRSRRTTFFDYIFYGLMLVVLAFKWTGRSFGGGGAGGRMLSQGSVAGKAGETQALMESIARTDPDFAPEPLRGVVRDIFFKVQDAWQKRDYGGLGDIMLPYLRASHSSKVENMRRRGEINMMEDVTVKRVDFVHVSCPAGKEGRGFTALITASARDYTISESSGSLISGSRLSSDFQEFWTFHQLNGRWALARIDQVGETDYLGAANKAEPLDSGAAAFKASGAPAVATLGDPGSFPLPMGSPGDIAMTPVPASSAAPAAAAMPEGGFRPQARDSLPPAAARSVTGASRWDRQKMEIAATLAFESVYTAWGTNDPAGLSADFVSAEALAKLRRLMDARKAEGLTFGFDSFYTRRAEVVLTSPAEKNPLRLDEFTARITATAQRSMLRNGRELHRDASPEPFTEYWVFGRQNESWKLRDILPRMDQAGEDKSKDGAPNPSQIEWYWEAA